MWYARGKPGDAPHFSRNRDLVIAAMQEGEVLLAVEELPSEMVIVSRDGASLIEVAKSLEAQWHDVRAARNILLDKYGWTVAAHSPLSQANQLEWLAYLQTLNRITVDYDDPAKVVWPEEPGRVYG